MSALLLLASWTPLLFQGQEFGATTPFLYFADVMPDLQEPIRAGRFKFLAQFPSLASAEAQAALADPLASETFQASKLDLSEREKFPTISRMYRDLIRLRKEDRCFARQEPGAIDGAVLGPQQFFLRFFGSLGDDRLLVVNFGAAVSLEIVPEPLLAPPLPRQSWQTLWSSESVLYGGPGEVPLETARGWQIPAESAVALHPVAVA